MAKAKKKSPRQTTTVTTYKVASKSVAKRLATQAPHLQIKGFTPQSMRDLKPLEFEMELFYYWCEGSEWKTLKADFVSALLRQFSERHGTFVVPGRRLWDFACMAKRQTGVLQTEFLNAALAAGLIKPLQGP